VKFLELVGKGPGSSDGITCSITLEDLYLISGETNSEICITEFNLKMIISVTFRSP